MVRVVGTKIKHYLIAISCVAAFFTVAFYAVNVSAAAPVGTVTYVSGPLFVKKADASVKALSKNSVVEQGDVVITEKRTYARIKFSDDSEVTLRPGSEFKIESFSYEQAKPKEDKYSVELIKGGLRAISGHVGKRGDPDSYKMKTRAAVIGIRGTVFELRICAGDCDGLADGLYFFVAEGSIMVSNSTGSLTIGAGQYAYVKDFNAAPVMLPGNPGIDLNLPNNFQQAGGCIARGSQCF